MMNPEKQNINEQYSSYRRGIVLGLTMAEVGILIIFVLLLLVGIEKWQREKQSKNTKGKELINKEQLQDLKESEQTLTQIKNQLKIRNDASSDEITRLIRAIQEINENKEGQSILTEVRSALDQIRDIRKQLEKKEGSESFAKQFEKQSYRIANQEGQLQRYENQLKDAGLGKGERPCWVKPDGSIEYLYDVVLTSNGIKMREYRYENRESQRALLPMPFIDEKEILSKQEFLIKTEPLYNHSLAVNCRFFVVIYDDTAPTEKEIYKDLLRTVESHFYKRLSLDKAPF